MDVTFDLIEDSLVEENTFGVRIIRRCDIANISASQKSSYLIRAMEAGGMPRLNDRHPDRPQATCQRRLIRSVADGTGATVELEYSSFIGDVTVGRQETLLVEENTGLTNELVSECIIFTQPKGKRITAVFTPLKFDYTPSGGNRQTVIGRANVLQMIRSLTVTRITRRKPEEIVFECPGFVNDRDWINRGKGYWLCANAGRAREFEYGTGNEKWWAVKATFLSRVRRTWAEVDFARDSLGRVFEDIDLIPAQNFVFGNYEHKLFTYNGGMAVGPYPLADFKSIFGYDYNELYGTDSATGASLQV